MDELVEHNRQRLVRQHQDYVNHEQLYQILYQTHQDVLPVIHGVVMV